MTCGDDRVGEKMNNGPELPGRQDNTTNLCFDCLFASIKVISRKEAHSTNVDAAFDSEVKCLIHEDLLDTILQTGHGKDMIRPLIVFMYQRSKAQTYKKREERKRTTAQEKLVEDESCTALHV